MLVNVLQDLPGGSTSLPLQGSPPRVVRHIFSLTVQSPDDSMGKAWPEKEESHHKTPLALKQVQWA